MATAEKSPLSTASAFWVVAYLISLVGLIWIAIWAYFNNSIRGAVIAIIFFMMLVTSVVLSRRTLYQSGTFQTSATSFTLGFIIWSILGSTQQSILSVSQNNLFAAISSELPQFLEFIMNTFVIPIAEESLWIIAIPDVLTFIMDKVSGVNNLSFFKNKILQIAVIVVVGASTFALFHVGNLAFVAFLVAAIIFRTAMILFVVGDRKINLVPTLTIVPAFAVGAHIGNNLSSFGFQKGWTLLVQNFAVGWMVFAIFLIIFLSSVNQIFGWFFRLFGGDNQPGR